MYGLNGDIAQDHLDMHLTNQYRDDMRFYKKSKQLSNIFNLYTMKTSKVKAVQANGTWDSPNGIFYKFEYQMEDNQIVNAMHKTAEGFFKVGQEVEYEITKPEYNSGKVRKPEQGFQGSSHQGSTKTYVDNTKGIKIGHAITNGVSIFLSNGSFEAMDMKESIKAYAKMIHQISEELNNEL
jgi:hypothetical protein